MPAYQYLGVILITKDDILFGRVLISFLTQNKFH